MTVTINGATNVTYIYINLADVQDARKLYLSAITMYNQNKIFNVIKSNEVLHIVFTSKEHCEDYLNEHFPNWASNVKYQEQ